MTFNPLITLVLCALLAVVLVARKRMHGGGATGAKATTRGRTRRRGRGAADVTPDEAPRMRPRLALAPDPVARFEPAAPAVNGSDDPDELEPAVATEPVPVEVMEPVLADAEPIAQPGWPEPGELAEMFAEDRFDPLPEPIDDRQDADDAGAQDAVFALAWGDGDDDTLDAAQGDSVHWPVGAASHEPEPEPAASAEESEWTVPDWGQEVDDHEWSSGEWQWESPEPDATSDPSGIADDDSATAWDVPSADGPPAPAPFIGASVDGLPRPKPMPELSIPAMPGSSNGDSAVVLQEHLEPAVTPGSFSDGSESDRPFDEAVPAPSAPAVVVVDGDGGGRLDGEGQSDVVTRAMAAAETASPAATVVVVVTRDGGGSDVSRRERELARAVRRLERRLAELTATTAATSPPPPRTATVRATKPAPRVAPALTLRVTEDRRLREIAARRSLSPDVRKRARIVLETASGRDATTIAGKVGVHVSTVRRWQGRFAAERMALFAGVPRSR